MKKKNSPPNMSQWGRKEGDESENILSLPPKLDFWECAVAWLGSGETEVQKYGSDPRGLKTGLCRVRGVRARLG